MTNIKQANRGFTIVELLIVIVVIAILAAISIVAYNGIQDRGKSSSAQSLASQVAKKAEAYNTVESSYPTTIADFNSVDVSELDDPTAVAVTGLPSDETTVTYDVCTAGGAQVIWYDAVDNNRKAIGIGGVSSGVVTALCA